jgi:hypothetical protein
MILTLLAVTSATVEPVIEGNSPPSTNISILPEK